MKKAKIEVKNVIDCLHMHDCTSYPKECSRCKHNDVRDYFEEDD